VRWKGKREGIANYLKRASNFSPEDKPDPSRIKHE
jgi:hypothetical protein